MPVIRPPVIMLFLLIWLAPMAFSQPLVVGGYHYPPFIYSQTHEGLYLKLTHAIEQHSQLTFQWRFYPYARVDHLFNLGKVQLEVGSSPLWNQHKTIVGEYSIPFYELEDVAVFRQTQPERARNHDDIRGQKIGIVRGYSFPQFSDTFEQNIAKKIEGTNEQQLLHLLLNKRIDQVFMSKHVFLYLKQQHKEYEQLAFKDVVGRYQVSIRVHPQHKAVIPHLNHAIEQLQKKNKIKELFESAQ